MTKSYHELNHCNQKAKWYHELRVIPVLFPVTPRFTLTGGPRLSLHLLVLYGDADQERPCGEGEQPRQVQTDGRRGPAGSPSGGHPRGHLLPSQTEGTCRGPSSFASRHRVRTWSLDCHWYTDTYRIIEKIVFIILRQLLYKYVTNEGEEMNCKDKAAVLIDGRNKTNRW